MADTAKVLAQSYPDSGTLTTAYTVPTSTSAVVSTIKACNLGPLAAKIRVSAAVAAASDTQKQYLYYDLLVAANDSFSATEGWTLATTDVIRVQSDTGTVAFNIFGVEIT